MALRLAIELSEQITAVAAVGAAMAKTSACGTPAHPVSVLFMHGTADPILPYKGGEVTIGLAKRGSVISTDASVQYWVKYDQTKTEAEVKKFPPRSPGEHESVTRYIYCCGSEGTAVALYKIENGGHTEPSIKERYSGLFKGIVGSQNGDIEMAEEVWQFFKDKQKRR